MQQRLVLGGDARGSGDGSHRLHAFALGRHEQPGAVVAQRRGAVRMADDIHQGLDEHGKPGFALLITTPGHRCTSLRARPHSLPLRPGAYTVAM
jgi:hypothetical protein